ncbi:protein phosphatase 1 regulatory subunit 3B isoform X1 [Sander lucioperca]|uniref:protein phosphatase 1 regulatory subunit 3B isoform X1 n=1 Tax=Sander lucioperca TaxID=283035 RepID=UPI00125D6372|nr:protein phosphatase 1 regulatory subunit 3B isoform X1 [Sander lucioperca]XP_035847099.1 protein phosphatase 1 regulatory subunit 3B isoform X1 [Sander lucioperca]
MPIDMALPRYLSKEEFIYQTSTKTCQPSLNSCLSFEPSPVMDQTEPEDAPSSREDSRKTKNSPAKKQVTFADHRGLSLTRVKLFSQFDDPIDIPLNVQSMLCSAVSLAAQQDNKLALDFAQPSSDYLLFRQRLEADYVCLEQCVLREKVLAGTVKVRNISFEKSVKLRLTSDGWQSHADVDCEYMKDAYPSMHSDTFSFSVAVPERLAPWQRMEFAVCYTVAGREYWDSNQGGNYCIVWASAKTSRRPDAADFGIHLERYGSPTCSHGLFPDWPSYAGYENTGPYY